MSFFSKQRRPYKQHVGENSMTQQHMKESCDINVIMKKYEKTRLLEHVNHRQGQYGDFTLAPDYHTALNQLHAAQEMFMELPSKLRERFANDPGNFLDFVSNPENVDEMRELGLLPKEKPVKVETPAKAEKKAVETQKAPKEGSPEADQV